MLIWSSSEASPPAAAFLEACVRANLNLIVAGGTQAGKTPLPNCLAAAIPGGDRMVTAEEVLRAEIPAPRLGADADPSVRPGGHRGDPAPRPGQGEPAERPSLIIVGEVRAEECLDLLLALNAGLPGTCTLHANSARESLLKMCTLPLLAGDTYPRRSGWL